MAGEILIWTTDVVPNGWLLCDGSTYDSVTDTSLGDLFASIGTTYGGTGANDFDLPDLRGGFPLGKDNMGGASANRVTDAQADSLGGSLGFETHVLSVSELPSHNHSNGAATSMSFFASSGTGLKRGPGNTGSKGGGSSHNNMPPYLSLNFIIKK